MSWLLWTRCIDPTTNIEAGLNNNVANASSSQTIERERLFDDQQTECLSKSVKHLTNRNVSIRGLIDKYTDWLIECAGVKHNANHHEICIYPIDRV